MRRVLGVIARQMVCKNGQIKGFRNKVELFTRPQFRFANKTFDVPNMGDSITEGAVQELLKQEGDFVEMDEIVALIETDKIQIELKAEQAGKIVKLHAAEGDTIEVGKPFMEIDIDSKAAPAQSNQQQKPQEQQQQAQQQQTQQQPVQQQQTQAPKEQPKQEQTKPKQPVQQVQQKIQGSRNERREPMSRMRQRIAQRLKDSQNTYAQLTTFQEVDMSAVMQLRKELQDDFVKKHNIKLGFMSFFVRAAVMGLQQQPIINSVIDGKDIIYRDFVDISVAVATPNGLLVPVLRNCESMDFADIERELMNLAQKGKNNKITPDDMAGGTFTISNGGVFGSLMGTPILNPPQSAILGMHAIINRPVCVGTNIEARPMMNIVLTYDHRLIDGREAATFLKKMQSLIQDPRRMLLDI